MANYLIQDSTLTNIANSIRGKTGKSEPILTENMSDEIDSITGEDYLKYATELKGTFYHSDLQGDIVFNLPNCKSFINPFDYSGSIKSLKFLSLGSPFSACGFLFANHGCKEIWIPEQVAFSKLERSFCYCSILRKINGLLDLSECSSIEQNFLCAERLEEVRFANESIFLSLSIGGAPALSPESIQSIIDGLATVEAPQTLTLNSAVKAKLTPEQTQTISAKNWILA